MATDVYIYMPVFRGFGARGPSSGGYFVDMPGSVLASSYSKFRLPYNIYYTTTTTTTKAAIMPG